MNRMDIRRRMLESAASSVSLSYTGDYDYFGDPVKGFAVLKTSGTLSIKGTVDLCLVGGGGKGYKGYTDSAGASYCYGGGGGAGGFVSNYIKQSLEGSYSVTIGAGSGTKGTAGGQTIIGTSYTANGGNSPAAKQVSVTGRGTSGAGCTSTGSGGNGEDGVFPFDDSTNFSNHRVSGCGGGGAYRTRAYGTGGVGGGGDGGKDGAETGVSGGENTGGGGGGGAWDGMGYYGGDGGSGVVLIRWGYTH